MSDEGKGWIDSAAEVERAAVAKGRNFSQLHFPPCTRPDVRLGRELQLNMVELRKADRLGQLPERLSAWIA